MNPFFQDLRDGLRVLAKTPGFTGAAVLTLALGIGANTVIFSVVNALFLRGLPAENPGALISLGFTHKNDVGLGLISFPDFEDIQRQTTVWADLFAYRYGVEGLSEGDRASHFLTSYVTGDPFSALGVRHSLGRLVLLSEGRVPGADPVMVLGYSYWKTRLGGDPSFIGTPIRVEGCPVTVVGVAEQGFRGVLPAFVDVQAYLPPNMAHTEGHGVTLTNRATRATDSGLCPGALQTQLFARPNALDRKLRT